MRNDPSKRVIAKRVPRALLFAVTLTTTFFSQSMFAQKDFLLSMPEENKYAFNPAYAGLESSLEITAWGREQWSGIPGRPSSQSLSAHMPLYALKGGGGLRIVSDKLGPFQYLKFELGYDYVLAKEDIIWSLGLTAGLNQLSFDGQKLQTVDGLYTGGLIDHNDPSLPENNVSNTSPTVSFGGYVVKDAFEGGISIQDLTLGSATFSNEGAIFDWLPQPTLNVYFEYGMDVALNWYLYPDLFVKTDFKDIQSLIKLNALYQEVFNVGLGVRGYSGNTFESIVISVGYVVDNHLRIHYAYDVGMGGLAAEASGSHEIILRYNMNQSIGKGRIPTIIGNPRYL